MKKLLGLPNNLARIIIITFLITFIIYCLAWPSAPYSIGDSSSYIDLGIKMKNGSMDSPHYRLIGYPLFLILTGSIPQPIKATFYISIIFHFISIWLLCYILYELNSINTLHFFCIVLLLPPYLESSAVISTEILAQFSLVLMLSCLFCWYKKERYLMILLAGIFCAISFLAKPTYILLCFALIPLIIISNRIIRVNHNFLKSRAKESIAIFLLIIPTILSIAGYYSYNYLRFSYLGITPRVGFQLFTKNLKYLESIPDNQEKLREALIDQRNKELLKRGSSHTGTQFIFGPAGSINKIFENITNKRPEELDREMLKLNLLLIIKKPILYFREVGHSLVDIWCPTIGFYNKRWLQITISVFHFMMVGLFYIYLIFLIVRWIVKLTGIYNLVYSYLSRQIIDYKPDELIMELTAVIIIFYTVIISAAIDVGHPRHLTPVLVLIWFLIFIFVGQWQKAQKPVPRDECNLTRLSPLR